MVAEVSRARIAEMEKVQVERGMGTIAAEGERKGSRRGQKMAREDESKQCRGR